MGSASQSDIVVVTPRLRGEPITRRHLDVVHALHTDERVMRTLGGVRSPAETEAIVDGLARCWLEDGFGYWFFTDRDSGQPVGRGGLRRVEIEPGVVEVEVGWAVVADRWREGLGTEIAEAALVVAFEVAGLESVVAFTLPDNEASLGLMRRCGFAYERDITWAGLAHVLYRRMR